MSSEQKKIQKKHLVSRLFRLNPGLDDQPYAGTHVCLAFGPRGERVVELLVEAPIFGDTSPVETQSQEETTALDDCHWLAFIIDAADPQALVDAGAAAQRLAQQDIYLRFALVLEGETPPEPTMLVPLNQALDGVVLLGQDAYNSDQSAAPEATAMALIEHLLTPVGLIGVDLADVRSMLHQGLGVHRAVGIHCSSSTLGIAFDRLVSIEPLEQAQIAMIWLAGSADFDIAEFGTLHDTLLAHCDQNMTFLTGIGVVPTLPDNGRNLVLLYG